MKIIRDESLRSTVSSLKEAGHRVGLVPTMGALHEGHLSLITQIKQHCDKVIVSIFVNPTQFGEGEDFTNYPRQEEEDLSRLEGVDIAFLPTEEVMYPKGFCTEIHLTKYTDILCGAHRPGHFDGVATIVTKLLLQASPDIAIFGEKDYQQLFIINRLVKDLNIPTKIMGAPIIREQDGLALSSRNAYLSEDQRKIAPALYQTLQTIHTHIYEGEKIEHATEWGTQHLLETGFDSIDYLEVRNTDTLQPLTDISEPGRIFVAAYLGNCRLIDNISLET